MLALPDVLAIITPTVLAMVCNVLVNHYTQHVRRAPLIASNKSTSCTLKTLPLTLSNVSSGGLVHAHSSNLYVGLLREVYCICGICSSELMYAVVHSSVPKS